MTSRSLTTSILGVIDGYDRIVDLQRLVAVALQYLGTCEVFNNSDFDTVNTVLQAYEDLSRIELAKLHNNIEDVEYQLIRRGDEDA